jgi:hypothetical protein
MFNIFSDSELRARQDVLDGQWNGLWGTYNATCTNGLGNAFPAFATDYNNWKTFYSSESDYTTASKHTTDQWQSKAQEWAQRLKDYGCGDSSLGNDLGIPGVKDNPADQEGTLDKLEKLALAPFNYIKNLTIGIGILVLIAVLALVYFINRRNFSLSQSGIGVSS